MDILSVIQTQYMSFSPKERGIADYVLDEGNHIENVNIAILANTVGVSPGTITRFCRKIGCPTFADFKLQLGRARVDKTPPLNSDPLSRVNDFYREVIESTDKMMDRESVELIAAEIRQAKYIYGYGIGSSGLSANELLLRLMRMGFRGQCLTDPHLMLINSAVLTEGDLVIAFSVSGETAELVNAASVARKNGCRVLSLTCFVDSKLAHNSDLRFTVPNSRLVDRELFFNSQFAFLYVIDLLTTIFLQDEALKNNINLTIETILEQNKRLK